jgi:hypothetical protein
MKRREQNTNLQSQAAELGMCSPRLPILSAFACVDRGTPQVRSWGEAIGDQRRMVEWCAVGVGRPAWVSREVLWREGGMGSEDKVGCEVADRVCR